MQHVHLLYIAFPLFSHSVHLQLCRSCLNFWQKCSNTGHSYFCLFPHRNRECRLIFLCCNDSSIRRVAECYGLKSSQVSHCKTDLGTDMMHAAFKFKTGDRQISCVGRARALYGGRSPTTNCQTKNVGNVTVWKVLRIFH